MTGKNSGPKGTSCVCTAKYLAILGKRDILGSTSVACRHCTRPVVEWTNMQMRNSSSVIQPVGLLAQTENERGRKWSISGLRPARQRPRTRTTATSCNPTLPFPPLVTEVHTTCLIYPPENRPLEFEWMLSDLTHTNERLQADACRLDTCTVYGKCPFLSPCAITNPPLLERRRRFTPGQARRPSAREPFAPISPTLEMKVGGCWCVSPLPLLSFVFFHARTSLKWEKRCVVLG